MEDGQDIVRAEKTIRERVAALLSIKSLVTLILALCFVGLAAVKIIPGTDVTDIFKIVIVFYFGTQAVKEK